MDQSGAGGWRGAAAGMVTLRWLLTPGSQSQQQQLRSAPTPGTTRAHIQMQNFNHLKIFS